MLDIVIIGAGPAGISAALYAKRAGAEVTVIYNGKSALQKAEKIENYYGFKDAVTGSELEQNGIEGAKKLGVIFKKEEVVGILYEDMLIVETDKQKYKADGVIIATGSPRTAPKIKGITEYEGKGVSFCAVCDAFFYRGRNVAVLGYNEFALHELSALLPVVKSAVILTNGETPTVNFPEGVSVYTSKVAEIKGGDRVSAVMLESGEEIETDGLFVAYGTAGSTQLAKKIGAVTDGNKILVDENMATNIPGLYAAGDCTGGLLQISKAVYEGAKSATELLKQLRKR